MIEDCNAARQASKHVPQEDWDAANRKPEPRYLDFGPATQTVAFTVGLDSDDAQNLRNLISKTLSDETDGESDHWSNAPIEVLAAIAREFHFVRKIKPADESEVRFLQQQEEYHQAKMREIQR